jgi:hypothetical protein
MPEWLLAALGTAGIGILGQILLYIGMVKIAGVRLDDHDRRLAVVEKHKVDRGVYEENAKRVDGRLDAADHGISNAGQRMLAIDARITSIHGREDHL